MKKILFALFSFFICISAYSQTYYPTGVTTIPQRPFFPKNTKVGDSLGVVGKSFFYGKMEGYGGFLFQNTSKKVFSDSFSADTKTYFGLCRRPAAGSTLSVIDLSGTVSQIITADTSAFQRSTIYGQASQVYLQSAGKINGNNNTIYTDSIHSYIVSNLQGVNDTSDFGVKATAAGLTYRDGLHLRSEQNGTGYLWNYENGSLLFGTNNVKRWTITTDGYFEANGAQRIYSSTGNLSIESLIGGSVNFRTQNTDRWSVNETGDLVSNGADTIRSSTGNFTITTGGANGNIVLTPNGTGSNYINGNFFQQSISINNSTHECDLRFIFFSLFYYSQR